MYRTFTQPRKGICVMAISTDARGIVHVEKDFFEARGYVVVIARDDALVVAYDNVWVFAYDDACVLAHDNSRVFAFDKARVSVQENSRVFARDNAKIAAVHNSMVFAYGKVYVRLSDDD